MIQGKKRIELTMDSILKLVSEYDIYRHFFGNFELNVGTTNHLRGEKNGSFIIGNKYGHIGHFDFSDPEWRGDCFNLVKKMYSLATLDDVLRKIDSEMGLGISGIKKDYKTIINTYKQPEITKRNTLIQITTRKFTHSEIQYWADYFQDIEDLKQDNIYSIKNAYLNKKILHLAEMRFGYFYPKGGYWKIYQPFESKKRKWMGNVPLTYHWGTENLNKDHNSLIAKSLKDYKVCRKIFPYVCGVQNESLGAFSEELVNIVKNNSKVVYYGGDSDAPGKKASYAITEAFGFKHINPLDRLLPECNDFACWAKTEGLKKVEEHFIKKGLII